MALELMSSAADGLKGRIAAARTTRKLDLSNSRLSAEDLPQEMFELKGLRSLTLYRNQLKSLPDLLWSLESLTELNLYRNRLTRCLHFTISHHQFPLQPSRWHRTTSISDNAQSRKQQADRPPRRCYYVFCADDSADRQNCSS